MLFIVHVVVLVKNMEPLIDNVGTPPVVNAQPVTLVVIFRQAKLPVIVTLPGVPLKESKNTESAAVGTDAPLDPPEEADQTVVLDVFQVPAPPTQYLFATAYTAANCASSNHRC